MPSVLVNKENRVDLFDYEICLSSGPFKIAILLLLSLGVPVMSRFEEFDIFKIINDM